MYVYILYRPNILETIFYIFLNKYVRIVCIFNIYAYICTMQSKEINKMSRDEIESKYSSFLTQILPKEILMLAIKFEYNPKTIKTYLDFRGTDILRTRAIVESALEILSDRGIIFTEQEEKTA